MKEEIIRLVASSLEELSIRIDDAYEETIDNNKYLSIVLDADEYLNVEQVAEAARIIDPLIEEADLIDDSYILDIYAKSKGEKENEQ